MQHLLIRYIGIPATIFILGLILLIFISTKFAAVFFLAYPVLIVVWWGIVFSRWLYKQHSKETLGYLLSNLFCGLGISAFGFIAGVVLENALGVWVAFIGIVAGFTWLVRSVYQIIFRQETKYKSIHWLLLERSSSISQLLANPPLVLNIDSKITNPDKSKSKNPIMDKKNSSWPSIFRNVSLTEATDNERKPIPIPPREAKQSNLSVDTWLSTSLPKSRFIEQAKKYVGTIEKHATPMAFMQYWPTYDSMNNAQRKWYFYWRAQVHQGNYLPVDLSYLFLHIYEVIHLIGFDSTKNAFKHLANLWVRYRVQHPKLDGYLIDWIADFIVVYKLHQTPMDWYFHTIKWGANLTDANIAIEAWLSNTKQDLNQIPSNVIDLISDYKYRKSKFYQQSSLQETIDKQLRQALTVIDANIRQQHGKSLFDYYRPTEILVLKRQPFAGAIYEGDRNPIIISTMPNWSNAQNLRSVVTSILKYTENRLRRQQNYKGNLNGIDLPTIWQKVLDSAYPISEDIQKSDVNNRYRTASTFQSPEDIFVTQATKFVDRIEAKTEPINFDEFPPTYEAMTEAQKTWYFYWRSQVRAGNYLPVDKSYFFTYIYEVLNLIGFKTAQAAYEHLKILWHNYHSSFQLDGYFVNWTADFLAFHQLDDKPFDWYAYVLEQGRRPSDKETAIEAWLSQGKSLSEIPIQLLRILSVYDPIKSNFYKQYNADGTIDKAYGQALEVIDSFLKTTTQKGLVETYRPANYYMVKHWPFGSALVAGRNAEVTIGKVYQWANATDFHALLGSIVKHTENLLRQHYSFRGSLRGIDLPSDWIKVLDQTFSLDKDALSETDVSIQLNNSPLVIDFAKVQALVEESDAVRERLTVADEVDVDMVFQPIAEDMFIPEYLATNLNTKRPLETPAHLLTELNEIAELLKINDKAVILLRHLMDSGWELAEAKAQAILKGEFVAVIIDQLNERAIELLGDHLIFVENDLLIVTEDYRDEVEHLFNSSVASPIEQKAADETHFGELQPEWAKFANKLQSQHWEALNAILVGHDLDSRLDGVARSVHSTVDLLIDEINEFALLSIGDIIIEVGSPPVVEEEDLPSMRLLMVWALKNIIEV